MLDNTHPLQRMAARAIDRATGRPMTFLPGGDAAKSFGVRGTFNPHPIISFPDGSQIVSEEPAVFVSGDQFAKLLDDQGANRDPVGGGMGPDFIRTAASEGPRRIMAALLQHNGYWRLTVTDPT